MRTLIAMLLLTASATAGEFCDFEHQCYPDAGAQTGQVYHGDLQHPDRVTPPPPIQYPGRQVTVHPVGHVCHLMTIREAPELPARIVEACTMSDEEEAAIRLRQRQLSEAEQSPWRQGAYDPN
jgi:hypothetical protein